MLPADGVWGVAEDADSDEPGAIKKPQVQDGSRFEIPNEAHGYRK